MALSSQLGTNVDRTGDWPPWQDDGRGHRSGDDRRVQPRAVRLSRSRRDRDWFDTRRPGDLDAQTPAGGRLRPGHGASSRDSDEASLGGT